MKSHTKHRTHFIILYISFSVNFHLVLVSVLYAIFFLAFKHRDFIVTDQKPFKNLLQKAYPTQGFANSIIFSKWLTGLQKYQKTIKKNVGKN